MQFSDFAFADPINRAIAEMGYSVPTPIQAQAIPVVLQGEDVMGAAQTGTGKSAGFALPIFALVLANLAVIRRAERSTTSIVFQRTRPVRLFSISISEKF